MATLRVNLSLWGAHACGVLANACRIRELLLEMIKKKDVPSHLSMHKKSSSPQNAETSTPKACAPQLLRGTLLFVLAITAAAQESPSPSPKSIRISFLPPPIEGTISLGIHDASGRLVRVLHREAELENFTIGQDALSTTWDGRNDADEALPPGKYRARGYAVGDIEVEGVGFFFNDWVADDDAPRIRRITRIGCDGDRLVVEAELANGETRNFSCNETGQIVGSYPDAVPEDKTGRDNTTWTIERGGSPTEVKQIANGEAIRRLAIPPDDPQPSDIAVMQSTDSIFLLEASAAVQRVRRLTLLVRKEENGQAVSDWRVDFEKKIVTHKEFTIQDGKPAIAGEKAPPDRAAIKLRSNPLKKDARETLELMAGFDAEGSFLQTVDGLPLHAISETPRITRVVLSPRGENELDFFQDDDAVVEAFRIQRLDQMMAFDAGEIEL